LDIHEPHTAQCKDPLIQINDLAVDFQVAGELYQILEGVHLSIFPGEIVALVGETGCGKSVTAKALLNLLPHRSCRRTGSIFFQGEDLLSLSEKRLQQIRGSRIGMIFQNPIASLNPVFSLGEQIGRLIRTHHLEQISELRRREGLSLRQAVHHIAVAKLTEVGLTEGDRLLKSYPHQISGGMAQRFRIAMALIGSPALLIADEATSALDVTVQAHILNLIQRQSLEKGTAVLLITHDLGIAAQICDRVAVMYAGRIVESGPTPDLFRAPRHPYTLGLLKSVPQMGPRQKLAQLPGIIPDLRNPPAGCRFHPRCPEASEPCRTAKPDELRDSRRSVACHLFNSSNASNSRTRTRGPCNG